MAVWKRSAAQHDDSWDAPGYRDLRRIGQGAFGTVYRAHQIDLDRTVAVKVLTVTDVDREVRHRFDRECRLAGRLTSHPNVVTVLEVGTTRSGRPFVAMEYYEQGSLHDRLRRDGPLPVAEVLRIGVKIAGALDAAHAEGVLHRDVKPQNILLSRFGEAVLADFGVARLIDATETAATGGAFTLAHTAPEVLDQGTYSASADVYSLASTLYQLLVGEPAFASSETGGTKALIHRILSEEVPEPRSPTFPAEVVEVLRRAMAKEPSRRPRGPREFALRLQDLQRALGMPVTEATVDDGHTRTPDDTDSNLGKDGPSQPSELVEATTSRPLAKTPRDPDLSETGFRPDRARATDASGRISKRWGRRKLTSVAAMLLVGLSALCAGLLAAGGNHVGRSSGQGAARAVVPQISAPVTVPTVTSSSIDPPGSPASTSVLPPRSSSAPSIAANVAAAPVPTTDPARSVPAPSTAAPVTMSPPVPRPVPPPLPTVGVARYLGDATGYHVTGTGPAPPGYHFEAGMGYAFGPSITPPPGTVPLYQCVGPAGQYMTSDDVHCENPVNRNAGVIVWLYQNPIPGKTVPLYRCHYGTGNTLSHFDTTTPGCEGQSTDGGLGYLLTSS